MWITPNDDSDDNLAGGEYRDYEIGNYVVFVSYASNGIARVFQVLEGLSDDGYFIAVVASSTSGKPVWTVQISEAGYQP